MKILLAAIAALLLVAAPAGAACTSSSQKAKRVSLTVSGQKSTGYASLPRRSPRALVVVAHGYNWAADSWKSKLAKIATDDRAVAVAPDIRGLRTVRIENGFKKTRGIPVRNGVADLIAYSRSYAKRCNLKSIVLVGYSIGGTYSGNALMKKPKRSNGKPLFDWYVGMETIEDVFGEFQIAKALPNDPFIQGAVADAKAELGGTIDEKPAAYHAVSPIEHVDRIKASGLRGAIFVHGIDDGLVLYQQSVDMTKALRKAGIKTDLWTARKRRPGDEPDTQLSARGGNPGPDSGHASDTAIHHLVPSTGLKVIHDLIVLGKRPSNRDRDVP
jgi:dipeptidyl aminopeptidase/acylaminoacyl peptidase